MNRITPHYTILAIETSLDDTCAAITSDNKVLSNVVASQVKFHEEYGGTVPHIARRMHQQWLEPTILEALRRARISADHIDAVAVTYGPGLAPCLEVGIAKAKEWAQRIDKSLIAVNHMEGHLLAFLAKNSKGGDGFAKTLPSPILGFLISGGHTQLVLMKRIGEYQLLGETLDDAAGEAYDKVARMLHLGYPGGPLLAELAEEGESKYQLPIPMRERQDLNFSFSGLKTAALYKLKELEPTFDRKFTADFAASFQQAVIQSLMLKFRKALQQHKPKLVVLGGGVVSNVKIRAAARAEARKAEVRVAIPYSSSLYTDNAAMIGVAGWYKAQRGEFVENLNLLDRKPNLNFLRTVG